MSWTLSFPIFTSSIKPTDLAFFVIKLRVLIIIMKSSVDNGSPYLKLISVFKGSKGEPLIEVERQLVETHHIIQDLILTLKPINSGTCAKDYHLIKL